MALRVRNSGPKVPIDCRLISHSIQKCSNVLLFVSAGLFMMHFPATRQMKVLWFGSGKNEYVYGIRLL